MLSVSQSEDRTAALVSAAAKAGADAADAIYVCNASTQISVRLGAPEDVERLMTRTEREGKKIPLPGPFPSIKMKPKASNKNTPAATASWTAASGQSGSRTAHQ